MPLDVDDFLDMLEERGIIAPNDVDSLRDQAEESPSMFHPAFIARRLVQLGYLNPYFAKTLLSDCASRQKSKQATEESRDKPVEEPIPTVDLQNELDDLGGLDLPDLNRIDLLSEASVERAVNISSLQAVQRESPGLWQRLMGTLPSDAMQRNLLFCCIAAGVVVLALFAFIVASMF